MISSLQKAKEEMNKNLDAYIKFLTPKRQPPPVPPRPEVFISPLADNPFDESEEPRPYRSQSRTTITHNHQHQVRFVEEKHYHQPPQEDEEDNIQKAIALSFQDLRVRPKEDQPDVCAICILNLSVGTTLKLRCGHRFHLNCINQALTYKRSCPMCRNANV
jgi:hypothetical protein